MQLCLKPVAGCLKMIALQGSTRSVGKKLISCQAGRQGHALRGQVKACNAACAHIMLVWLSQSHVSSNINLLGLH